METALEGEGGFQGSTAGEQRCDQRHQKTWPSSEKAISQGITRPSNPWGNVIIDLLQSVIKSQDLEIISLACQPLDGNKGIRRIIDFGR